MILRTRISLKHFLLIIFYCFRFGFCSSLNTDTINSSLILRDSDTIHSTGNQFSLGFFTPNGSTTTTKTRYLGIWYYVSPSSVTWVANRQNPLNDSSGTFTISSNGNLILMNGNRDVIWSTNASITSANINSSAQLLDSGNLVLSEVSVSSSSSNMIWESHRHPQNSFLPTMRISHNPRTGVRNDLNSWRSLGDPSIGNFTWGLDAVGIPQMYIWENGVPRWRSGPWNGRILTGVTGMYSVYVDGFNVVNEDDGTVYFTRSLRQRYLSRNFLSAGGVLVEASWDESVNDWNVTWTAPANDCDYYNRCGAFSVCFVDDSPICSCLRGYELRGGGCVRRTPLQGERANNATDRNREDGFLRLSSVKVPDFMQWSTGVELVCDNLCLRNSSCLAYAFDPGIGCMFWSETLIDIQRFPGSAGSDLYVRVAYSELDAKRNNRVVIIVSVIASLLGASICIFLAWCMRRRKRMKVKLTYENMEKEKGVPDSNEKVNIEELPLYSFEMLVNATNNFDPENKLGMGGFGPVFKGRLINGRDVAVKRLSTTSGQGYEEFMNEVVVISKLQHRNLVRLLGCCVEKEERMLIYEFLQNGSLDVVLFDTTQDVLDWRKRFNIIEGIGRGLLYLHRDSRLKIIHRDLKPSNILLDEYWNPKISDFGMARIFGGNQDQANTGKVVGTYGYMSPEYAMGGRFSEKSDVFSYGVLVLEIISGKRNTSFYNDEYSLGLLGYAWKLWHEDNATDFIDKRISETDFGTEIMRCMHIGLLCVQEVAADRPAMSIVVSMLSSEIVDLPAPEHPGFTDRWNRAHHHGSSSTSTTPSTNNITLTIMEGR